MNDITQSIISGLKVQIETLRAEKQAIKEAFGGYKTDRLMVLSWQIPFLELRLTHYEKDNGYPLTRYEKDHGYPSSN